MGWKHYQRVDPPLSPPPPPPKSPKKREPQVGRGLFGVHLLILHFKFQFFKSIISSTFHIYLNLNYPFRKKYLFPKMHEKDHPKIYTKPQTPVNEISIGIWRCLKPDRDNLQKGRVRRRQNSLHVYPTLTVKRAVIIRHIFSLNRNWSKRAT